MNIRYEIGKITFSSISTFVLALLGENYKLIFLLLCLMLVDTILGHLRAVKINNWKSYNARWGIIGKLIELVLVALMYLCEWTFNIDWLVNVVVIYFSVCEGASIIENIVKGKLNENVPRETLNFLLKLKANIVTIIKKMLNDYFGDGGGSG
jgi:toxin secretion/phage lysis holin